MPGAGSNGWAGRGSWKPPRAGRNGKSAGERVEVGRNALEPRGPGRRTHYLDSGWVLTFALGLVAGLMIGVVIGVVVMAALVASREDREDQH
jgi:hypothetical protein